MQIDFLEPQKSTKFYRVKQLLELRGLVGATNSELNDISFRYSAIIHKLRESGHEIDTIPVRPQDGLYKYVWRS